jgi:hypothetical protein
MKAKTKALKKALKAAAPKNAAAGKVAAKAPVTPKQPVSATKTKPALAAQPPKEQTTAQAIAQAMSEGMDGALPATNVLPTSPMEDSLVKAEVSTTATPAPKAERLVATEIENVKLRKVPAHADDVAAADKAAPGRFEVLIGGVKAGEVAFRSLVKMKEGAASGFRHYWQGEDMRGAVVFTDGKRMKDVVAQIADVAQGRLGIPLGKVSAQAKEDFQL